MIWSKQYFNSKWAEGIHKACEKYPDEHGDSYALSSDGNVVVPENYLMKIIPSKKEPQIVEALKDIAMAANERMFGFNLWYDISAFQYTTYESELQMEYDWHSDSVWVTKPVVPKLTVIVGLTNKDNYQGGDFVLAGGKKNKTIKLTAGEAIAFPSIALHKVTPVTSGTRNTLVAWFKGPRWV